MFPEIGRSPFRVWYPMDIKVETGTINRGLKFSSSVVQVPLPVLRILTSISVKNRKATSLVIIELVAVARDICISDVC